MKTIGYLDTLQLMRERLGEDNKEALRAPINPHKTTLKLIEAVILYLLSMSPVAMNARDLRRNGKGYFPTALSDLLRGLKRSGLIDQHDGRVYVRGGMVPMFDYTITLEGRSMLENLPAEMKEHLQAFKELP